MKYRSLVLCFSVLALGGSAASEERDPYVGDWSGTCGRAYQCWLEIEHREAKSYDVRFRMADRMDARKIVCKEDIQMKRRPLKFDMNNSYPDSLAGSMHSDPFLFILPGMGSVTFVTEAFCKGERFGGEYVAIGD